MDHSEQMRQNQLAESLLPAGPKFCKITQNRPKKESDWPGKFAAVRPPFFDKSSRKQAKKNIL
jgi:hypothetical protein